MTLNDLLDLLSRIPAEERELTLYTWTEEGESRITGIEWDQVFAGDKRSRVLTLHVLPSHHGLGRIVNGAWVRLMKGEEVPVEHPPAGSGTFFHLRSYPELPDLPDPPEDDIFKLPD